MEQRKLLIGEYDTATDGLWTLSYCMITKAEQVQNLVDVPGRYAPLDLSTSLTDGQPYYSSAYLDATLESSEGDRSARQTRINDMVNRLDGLTWEITHPDHPEHYMVGRVQIYPQYNDMAHGSVTVYAVCDPWLYSKTVTVKTLTASSTAKTVELVNNGRMVVIPEIRATGNVTLEWGDYSWALAAGDHVLPDLCLLPGGDGETELVYSGSGTITIEWREAILAA